MRALGAGLVAAAFWSAFPSVSDAVASPLATESLALVLAGAVLLCIASSMLRGGGQGHRMALVAAAVALADVGLAATTASLGAGAFHPSAGLAFAVAVVAAETVAEMQARGGVESGPPRLLVAGVVALLVAEGGLAVAAASSWQSPKSFWGRAVEESPESPAALGAFAREAELDGDRDGSTRALRRFVLSIEKGEGRNLSGPAERSLASVGCAEASASLLRDAEADVDDRAVADEALRAALHLDPENGTVLRVVGEARRRDGDLEQAVPLLEKAVAADPANASAWNSLAQALLDVPRVVDALAAARQATGLDPDNRDYTAVLGWALHENELDADALYLLNDSLGNPPHIGVSQALASISHRVALAEVSAGRRNRARRLLMRALQVWPLHREAREQLDVMNAAMNEELDTGHLSKFRPIEGEQALPDNLIIWAAGLSRWGEYERAAPVWA
ncbi:MAG: tetratricopeptide repeat protein, partial [Planctomycetota bacterium]